MERYNTYRFCQFTSIEKCALVKIRASTAKVYTDYRGLF